MGGLDNVPPRAYRHERVSMRPLPGEADSVLPEAEGQEKIRIGWSG